MPTPAEADDLGPDRAPFPGGPGGLPILDEDDLEAMEGARRKASGTARGRS